MDDPLRSWNDGAAKEAVLRFLDAASGEDSHVVPPEERVAVFDNDGTLWCEQPLPIQLDFILRRLAQMVGKDPGCVTASRGRRLARVTTDGWPRPSPSTTGATTRRRSSWRPVSSPRSRTSASTASRSWPRPSCAARGTPPWPAATSSAYALMVDLLGLLTDHGFATYIVSGGGRDFMRPISAELYGIPRERVIGSSAALAYTPGDHGGSITRRAAADYLDDGPEKPVHIWTRTGRRPRWRPGTPTGTSRCSTSPSTWTVHTCGCWSSTTTPSASSRTSPARSGRWSGPTRAAGRS